LRKWNYYIQSKWKLESIRLIFYGNFSINGNEKIKLFYLGENFSEDNWVPPFLHSLWHSINQFVSVTFPEFFFREVNRQFYLLNSYTAGVENIVLWLYCLFFRVCFSHWSLMSNKQKSFSPYVYTYGCMMHVQYVHSATDRFVRYFMFRYSILYNIPKKLHAQIQHCASHCPRVALMVTLKFMIYSRLKIGQYKNNYKLSLSCSIQILYWQSEMKLVFEWKQQFYCTRWKSSLVSNR